MEIRLFLSLSWQSDGSSAPVWPSAEKNRKTVFFHSPIFWRRLPFPFSFPHPLFFSNKIPFGIFCLALQISVSISLFHLFLSRTSATKFIDPASENIFI